MKVMKQKFDFWKFLIKNKNLISIVLFIILFLGVNLVRTSISNQFPTAESNIFLNEFNNYKNFNNIEGGNLFYELVIEFSFIFGQEFTIFFILFAFGILNIFLFNKISDSLLKRDLDKIIANTLFVLSNFFIASATTFNYLPIIITIILWTILFSLRKPTLVFIPIIVGLFINVELAAANLIFAIVFFIINKNISKIEELRTLKSSKFIKLNMVIPIVVFGALYLLELIKITPFLLEINYSWWVAGANSIYNIPIICLALGIFALFTEIKSRRITILFILIVGLSWINFFVGLISMITTLILAAIGTRYIILRKWFVKALKKPAILLLILLFVFNSISYSQSLIESGPSNAIVEDIKVLENFSINENVSTILCEFEDCEIVTLYSELEVYYSSNNYINKIDHFNKINSTETMLTNSNLQVMEDFFAENNISTVFISKKTLNNRWTRADEGILLLLTQSERFVRLNNTQESFIYHYTGKIDE